MALGFHREERRRLPPAAVRLQFQPVPDILLDLPVPGPPAQVFAAVATPAGLDRWWSATCTGASALGAVWQLGFGPEYQWQAKVTRSLPDRAFTLEFTHAMPDWIGSTVSFDLTPSADGQTTQLRFAHRGWPEESEHFRISCHCWSLYLRLMTRVVQCGEVVPYERRLEV
jgi:uncharacterized protein YndB with AHSA1/START domain